MLKVTAHGEHNVVSSIVTSLDQNGLDEGTNSLVYIVVKQPLVILKSDNNEERKKR